MLTVNDSIKILERARTLLTVDASSWIRDASARDSTGEKCNPVIPAAVSFDMLGERCGVPSTSMKGTCRR